MIRDIGHRKECITEVLAIVNSLDKWIFSSLKCPDQLNHARLCLEIISGKNRIFVPLSSELLDLQFSGDPLLLQTQICFNSHKHFFCLCLLSAPAIGGPLVINYDLVG